MEYTYKDFTTDDCKEFIEYILSLSDKEKENVMDAFWDAMGIEGNPYVLNSLSSDIIRLSEALFKDWVLALLDEMEDRAQYMYPDEGWVCGCITVKDKEAN